MINCKIKHIIPSKLDKGLYKGYNKYKVSEEIFWVEDCCINISKLEKNIIKRCKINYVPLHPFDGKTEIIDINKFKEMEL